MTSDYAYGHWTLVIGSILLVFFFLSRQIPLKTRLEKRSGGVLAAFIVALFTEMYGVPLTIYFLSSRFDLEIPFTHQYGHLFAYLLTYTGLNILYGWAAVMIVSNVMILVGMILIIKGWEQVYRSEGELVTTGIYARMRHPQYSGIFLGITGFLIQWPTLLTLILFPFVVMMYHRLAMREEMEVLEKFGDAFQEYRRRVPAFVPRISPAKRSSPEYEALL